MNQTTGDSKLQVSGAIVLKGKEEKEPIREVQGTAFETGTMVKLADKEETSVEIKAGGLQMVRLTQKDDGIDAIYIPATDQVLLVDQKQVTPEQHAAIKAKYEAMVKQKGMHEKEEQVEK